MRFTTQIIQTELDRYKAQKEALIKDETYINNEEGRSQLLIFYNYQIEVFKNMLSTKNCKHTNKSLVVVDAFANWEKTETRCIECKKKID